MSSTTLETAIVIDTSQFVKALSDAQTKATATGKSINSALEVKPTGNADSFNNSLKAAKDNAEKLKAELASVIATQGKSGAAYDDAVKKLKEATAEADRLESALADAANTTVKIKPPSFSDTFANSLKAAKDNAERLRAEVAQIAVTQGKGSSEYDNAVKKLKEATAEADKLEAALKDAGESSRDIAPDPKGFSALKDSFLQGQAGAGGLNSVLGGMAGTLGGLVNPIGAAVAGFGLLTAGLSAAIDIGKEFQTNLQAVSAVTGVTGAGLDDIGNRAVDLSKKFGGSASQQLTVFQTTLSKIGPQLAEDSEALTTFADNVNVLSKTDGALGAAGAVDALTGAMLQFGVNVNDSNEVAKESGRFINVLAASAAVGSASVSDVAGAIAVVGGTAKNANVSFEETNAALQVLASKSLTGSTAGTALTAVINKLQAASGPAADQLVKMGTSSQELGQILTTKGIGAAMDKLRGAMTKLGSTSEKNAFLVGLFGETGLNAASALLQGGEQLADFTKDVTGTNAATEQARINMATFSEAMSRLKATFEAVGITVYKVIEPALSFLANTAANLLSGEGLNASGFADAFRSIYKAVEPILNAIYGLVKNTIVVAFNLIQTVWTSVVGSVSSFAKQLGKIIAPLGDDIRKLFGSFGDGAGTVDTIKAAFVILGDVIGTVLKTGLGVVAKLFGAVISVIRGGVSIVQSFIDSIKSTAQSFIDFAKRSEFLRSAIDALQAGFSKFASAIGSIKNAVLDFLGMGEEKAPTKPIEELVEKTQEATSTTQANTQAVVANTTATADNSDALKKRADDISKIISAEKDLINSRVKNNDLARQYELAINPDTQLTEAQARLTKAKEEQQANIAILNTLLKQYSVGGDIARLEPFKNFDVALTEEQIRGIDNIQLNIGAGVDADTKTKIRDEIQNLLRSLVEQRVNIVSIIAEVDRAEIVKAGNEIKKEFENVGKFIGSETFGTDRDFETAKGLFEDLSKRISEVRNKGNKASTKAERIAYAQLTKELEAEYEKLQKELTKIDDSSAKERLAARLASIKDDTQRELAEKIIALEQQRDKELANRFLTEGAKRNITIRFEEQIQALRDKASKQSANTLESSFKAAYEGIAQSLSQINFADFNVKGFELLRNKLADTAKQSEELPKALASAKAEQEKLTQAMLDGSTDMNTSRLKLAENSQRLNELEQQQTTAKNEFLLKAEQAFYTQIATLAEQSFKQREQAIQNFLTAERTASAERQSLKQKELATNEKIIAQEKVLADAKLQLSLANTDANAKAVAQADLQLSVLKKQQEEYTTQLKGVLDSETVANKQRSAAFDSLLVNIGQQTVALLAIGDEFGKNMARMAFDAVSSLVDIYAPAIIANVMSIIPPPFGLIAGGVAVAGIKALLAGTKKLLKLKDGVVDLKGAGNSRSDSIPARLSKGESVMRADITKREKPLLEFLHKGGSSFEYFKQNYSQTVVDNNGQLLSMQAVSQLTEINQRLQGVESGLRSMAVQYQSMQNVNMNVTVDESVIVRNMSRNNRLKILRS